MNRAASPATVPVEATLPPGTVLGERFEIESVLGEGGMGVVYRAKDRAAGGVAAVKVLRRNLAQTREFVQRFKREARAASRFRHDAAVRILTTGETDDKLPWIGMELIDGRNLKDMVASDSPMTPGRVCNIAHQLLRALGSAHKSGIVHRDVKPENIRIVVDADGIERPKILDFGIAKFVRGDAGDVTGGLKTKTGVILGTPKYMSPEQVRGESVDGRADIYSVGAMIYEMLSGRPPFEATDVFGFVAMHLKEEVPPLTKRFPDLDIPHEVDEIVLRMLQKKPEERPADASELAEELEKFAVEDPKADAKAVALRKGSIAVSVAGVVAAGLAFVLARPVALPAAAACLGLGFGAALAARRFGRPSVYSFVKRVGTVGGLALGLSLVASLVPGSPGLVTGAAYGLSAVVVYAGFLLVWNSRAKPLRAVCAGLAAPALCLALFPVAVQPPGEQPRYYVTVPAPASDDAAKAALERDAKLATVLAVAAMGLLFGLASTVLPRPGAARLS